MKAKLLLAGSFLVVNCALAAPFQLPQQITGKETSEQTAIHRVALGETMVIIAKKYMVLPQDIYDLNPDAANGLSPGMALRIPVGKKVKVQAEEKNLDYEVVDAATLLKEKQKKQQEDAEYVSEAKPKRVFSEKVETTVAETATVTQPETVSHEVKPGETLTGLARKYNTTISEITSANQKLLKKGLQSGQVLVIPAGGSATALTEAPAYAAVTEAAVPTEKTFTENPATHFVKQGETLHSLARKYNLTVAEITAANEKLLKRGLQAGQTLVIPGGTQVVENNNAPAPEPVVVANYASYSDEPVGTTEHKVASGETLHGLARKYNTTVDAITAANQKLLKRGLQAGQTLKIPVAIVIADNLKKQ